MASVSEIMSSDVQVVAPEDSLRAAAQLMQDRDVGALPVCEGNTLVGIVTDRDIAVRGVAGGLDPDQDRVSDVMTDGVEVCGAGDDAQAVMRLMGEMQVRRLPVVNSDGRLMGIVSLADLATRQSAPIDRAVREISEPGPAEES
jgi:CBS domain-containing protein